MSQDLPIPRQDDRSDGTAVVEWGGVDQRPSGRPRRLLAGLARDRHLPLAFAGLGAAAGLASLIGEWVLLTFPNAGPSGQQIRVPEGVSDVGGFGAAYLAGLLALVAAVALALRGTGVVRPNARVGGLALAGALLTMLAAAATTVADSDPRAVYYGEQAGLEIGYGRGLVTAFLACVFFGAALLIIPTAAAPDAEAQGGEPVPPVRRSRSRRADPDDALPPPADLTVGPAVPFARPEPPA
ncbi:hypothetical protein QTQ03_20020 [Micromonospora sp. WMMA1363]|uniref:hypothetical protein n=1 Tax=Micromonospora sp. WMMA1363 TaxID=3053985 RepID=UPI00259CCEC5|nr:hypothetical protein [Micromonospora sp. WMMA1363]MDM4721768.1 hypothetical protein [Micromonospora sp. WMMA1363]